MDNKMKERNCVGKFRSKCKKKRTGYHGYKGTITIQSESMPMARNLSLSSVGKTEK